MNSDISIPLGLEQQEELHDHKLTQLLEASGISALPESELSNLQYLKQMEVIYRL